MDFFEDSLPSLLLDKIEFKVTRYMEVYNEDYKSLVKERHNIIDKYHNMLNFLEYNKPIKLTEEEHGVMIHYLGIENKINDMIKFMMYLCGHADCLSYFQIMDILQDSDGEVDNAKEMVL